MSTLIGGTAGSGDFLAVFLRGRPAIDDDPETRRTGDAIPAEVLATLDASAIASARGDIGGLMARARGTDVLDTVVLRANTLALAVRIGLGREGSEVVELVR